MRAFCAVVLCVLLGSAAHAATLEKVSGGVSINRGAGYLPVKGATSLKPGDTVMASPGARAEVVYDGSCRVPVEPGALHVVAAKSPCSRQAEWSPPSKLGGCSLKGDSRGCRLEPEPDRHHHLLIGAAVIGAGVGAIILLQDDDDKPSSP